MIRILVLSVIFVGCTALDSVITSDQAAFQVMIESARTNYANADASVKVSAFVYDEEFISALVDREAYKKHWSAIEKKSNLDSLRKEHLGDTMTVLVFLHNTQWPCTPPLIISSTGAARELIPSSMMPCEQYEIENIHHQIYIENERGERIKPSLVSKPNHATLTTDEAIWVRFPTSRGSYHWIDQSKKINLVLKIGPSTITLIIKNTSSRQ